MFNFNKTSSTGAAGTAGAATPSTTTSTTGTTAATTTTPAFNFNFGKSNATAAASAVAEPVQIPSELKNKTVKNVLETMESQLEQQARQFQTQARQIARWDRSIYDCLSLMQYLESQIKTVEGAQTELSQSASSLLQEQDNFIKTLREKTSKQDAIPNDQRSKLYENARKLGEQFLTMEAQLKAIVEQTDNDSMVESTSDIDKVAQIANCHLDSMQWISNQCAAIEEKLDAIQKSLPE